MEIVLAPNNPINYSNNISTEAAVFIDRIISSLKDTDCDSYFKTKLKKAEGKEVIQRLQSDLLIRLNELDNIQLWTKEEIANKDFKDRFDLFYSVELDNLTYSVVIELDACRADQVSKKFVSRTSHTLDKPTIYFAFCYPGTKHMAFAECVKYMSYCNDISSKLSSIEAPRQFVGVLINKKFKSKRKSTVKKKAAISAI